MHRITSYVSLRAARNPPPTCAHATERGAQEDNYKYKGAGCTTNDTPVFIGASQGRLQAPAHTPLVLRCTCAGSCRRRGVLFVGGTTYCVPANRIRVHIPRATATPFPQTSCDCAAFGRPFGWDLWLFQVASILSLQ
jgi:hypothetical protein